MSEIKYRRILLKVSGEALGQKTQAGDGFGLDFKKINEVCASIKACVDMDVQVGLVIGGGNFWRGIKNGDGKMQRSHADAMGMLATVMNAIAVADALEEHGMDARVLTAVEMNKNGDFGIPVPDYVEENVSTKVVKIIQSYTGVVNKMVWRKPM